MKTKFQYKKLFYIKLKPILVIIPIFFVTMNLSFADQEAKMIGPDQFEVLSIHNKLRAIHHADPLIWDKDLAKYAENYASKCEFKHSATHYGENLATGYPSLKEAIYAWYNERESYSFDKPGFSSQTGHFTQLVWKNSKKIGCGYANCEGRNGTPGNYLVCEYSPAGNIVNNGRFAQNVWPE